MDDSTPSTNNQQPKSSVKQKVKPYKKPLMLIGGFLIIAIVAFSGWAIFTNKKPRQSQKIPS